MREHVGPVICSNCEFTDHDRARQAVRAAVYSGLRIAVWDVLSWLAGGMSEQEILQDYPELEPEDFRAVYEFASRLGGRLAL